jgi:hypothetical protein
MFEVNSAERANSVFGFVRPREECFANLVEDAAGVSALKA